MPKKILCPYCFQKFQNTEAWYQCTNHEYNAVGEEICPSVVDEAFNEHWKYVNVLSKRCYKGTPFKKGLFRSSSEPQEEKCPVCKTPSNRYVCPHCHNWLPTEMIKDGAEIVSIIGAPSSGKTVYFISLIHELERQGYKLGIKIKAQDEAPDHDKRTSAIYQAKSDLMFDQHVLPDKTSEGRPVPLIFNLTTKKRDEPKKGRSIYLVFYDTAGESFDNTEQISDMARYLRESSGIIMLIDPFSVSALRTTLEAGGFSVPRTSSRATFGLDTLLGYIDQETGKQLGDKPFAITFSKIDAVINGLDASNADYDVPGVDLQENSSFIKTKQFDLNETKQIHDALVTVCEQKWELGHVFDAALTKFSRDNVKLFAVSSLGSQPTSSGALDNIKPYRVMDPLVWILTRMGGFDIPIKNN